MNLKDTLGDRIKRYESVHERYFTPKIPIIVRVDGKAFHTWTKGCERPFDQKLITTMFEAAKLVASEMQGCLALYAQSDEVTFVLDDTTTLDTQQWFGGRQNKIESVTAALMTAHFNKLWLIADANEFFSCSLVDYTPAVFDARAFQCVVSDVSNVFLWRVRDWERNSLTMYCSQFFSHKELDGKNSSDRHEILYKIGKNWATDCTDQQRNGSWWSKVNGDNHIIRGYAEIDSFIFEDQSLNA